MVGGTKAHLCSHSKHLTELKRRAPKNGKPHSDKVEHWQRIEYDCDNDQGAAAAPFKVGKMAHEEQRTDMSHWCSNK